MIRRLAVFTGTAVLLLGVLNAVARSAEDEMPTLRELESVDALKAEFNADSGKRRLLMLLSPT